MPVHLETSSRNNEDLARLASAQAGDEDAFAALTRPLQRELHIHCYRMLGTLNDADDALQETLLRAWRQLGRFEPRAPFRAWLYRIATNVCLTLLTRRTRRDRMESSMDRDASPRPGEPIHLHPYDDRLLAELQTFEPGPEAIVVGQEGIELAFVAAIQLLPPKQRAALLLRDVIGYSAAEVAPMLETTVASVNSLLQRARATLARARAAGAITWSHASPGTATERALVGRLVEAWHRADFPSIVALLTEDAVLTMPPEPLRFAGPEAIGGFLARGPGGGRLDRYRLVSMRTNNQPALAAYYRQGDAGPFAAHSILVLALRGEAIASLVRFGDPTLFARFGLPTLLNDAWGESREDRKSGTMRDHGV